MQLIDLMDQIFKKASLDLWLHPYEIIATGHDCGVIEFIKDGQQLSDIHKVMRTRYNQDASLSDYFRKNFGYPSMNSFKKAQENFANSLAAYSLVCYIL